MWKLKDDVMIIVLSDVHIGASVHHQETLIEVLDELKVKAKGTQLKVLIILGDFFDVIFESIRDYCKTPYSGPIDVLRDKTKNYQTIFDLMTDLTEIGIKIFFTLGNHEIKIISNMDKNFSSRKIKFRREFEKNSFKYIKLLNLTNISQYFILGVLNIDNQKRWALSSYDSMVNIFRTKQTRKPYIFQDISVPDSITKFNCLMTHGVQFESLLRTYGGGIPWWLGLISPDIIKETGNIIYQTSKGFFRELKDNINRLLEDQRRYLRSLMKIFLIAPFTILILLFLKLIKLIIRGRKSLKNESYYQYIEKKFLPNLVKGRKIRQITHIIFGHTHSPDFVKRRIKIGKNTSWNIQIYNSGAWQQIRAPSLIEIYTDGRLVIQNAEVIKRLAPLFKAIQSI